MKKTAFLSILGTIAWTVGSLSAASAVAAPREDTTPRIVVKYKATVQPEQVQAHTQSATTTRERTFAQALQAPNMRRVRLMSTGAAVYDLGKEMTLSDARKAAARIAKDSSVEYAEPDIRIHAHSVNTPNDTYAPVQWTLMPRGNNSTAAIGGANFYSAWGLTQGAGIVVGVIDTGILPHTDLVGQLVPGYDFISADGPGDFSTAADGDGRDNDPSDPGDACTTDGVNQSSWHGLKVASEIVALANNGYGLAGAAPGAKVMPLRALGRCGGFLSDAADAVSWASGQSISGIPNNNQQVHVLNLSLGASAGSGSCPVFFQQAVDTATAAGIPVVVASGNDGAADVGAPANCSGVITVGAHTKSGDLAVYSNHSSAVMLSGPGGGNCMVQGTDCQGDPTVAAGNSGLTSPGSPVEGNFFTGTSAATPQVAAAIALMRAANNRLTIAEIKSILRTTAVAFPASSACSMAAYKGTCGAGMLDAGAAVAAAQGLVATVTPSFTTATIPGNMAGSLTVAVTGNLGSSYQWTQVSGTAVTLSGANTSKVSFTTPAGRSTLVFRVEATTSVGTVVSSQYTVNVYNPPKLTVTSYATTVGQALSVQLKGGDADNGSVAYELTNAATGLAVTNAGNLTYAAATAGTYTADVVMTDSNGVSATQQISVAVTAQSASNSGSGSSSGGGGGGSSTDLVFLAIAAVGLGFASRRKAKSQA